jgi:hypothetical protein
MTQHRGFSTFNGRAEKADRLNRRVERQELKAARKQIRQQEHAERRARGIRGADIEMLPLDYQGLARTLAHGDVDV